MNFRNEVHCGREHSEFIGWDGEAWVEEGCAGRRRCREGEGPEFWRYGICSVEHIIQER